MPSSRRLTDKEIEAKFRVKVGTDAFAIARRIADMRADRTVNEMPFIMCPHCGHEYQKDDWYGVGFGDTWICEKCERDIHVEFVEVTTTVTLSTEPTR